MAQGILLSLDPNLGVFSAGTKPPEKVNPKAAKVMNEIGIDISGHISHNVADYTDESWDYVITVCGGANETCPVFNVKSREPQKALNSLKLRVLTFLKKQIKSKFQKA